MPVVEEKCTSGQIECPLNHCALCGECIWKYQESDRINSGLKKHWCHNQCIYDSGGYIEVETFLYNKDLGELAI